MEEFYGQDIFLTGTLTQKAIQAVEQSIEEDKPFFLYMSHYAVHTPIMGDKRYEQKYLDAGLHPIEAQFASLVEGINESLKDITDFVDVKGISDNSIILFMSDNGGLSAHGQGDEKHSHNYSLSSGKGSIHEGGIREPMVVKWPGTVKPQSECNEYLIIADFYPTILQMAGLKQLEVECQPINGPSFVDKLKGKKNDGANRPLFWHYPNNWGRRGRG